MPSGYGGGIEKGKGYTKIIVWVMVGGFVLWFLYEGFQLVTNFMN